MSHTRRRRSSQPESTGTKTVADADDDRPPPNDAMQGRADVHGRAGVGWNHQPALGVYLELKTETLTLNVGVRRLTCTARWGLGQ